MGIVSDYFRGKSILNIAKENKVGSRRIASIIDELAIDKRTRLWIPINELKQLYEVDGKTIKEIAEIKGHSPANITVMMKEYGIKTRGSNDYRDSIIDKSELYDMYVDRGLSSAKIGEQVGKSESTILNWLKHYGIKVRTPHHHNHSILDEVDIEYIKELYESGMSAKSSSKKLGYSSKTHSTITKHLKKYGVKVDGFRYNISEQERQLYDFVSSLDGSAISNYRIGEYEADIYLKDRNLAIEYNGIYWHSELNKKPNYHQKKLKAFNRHGIRLIQIWEDEWLNQNQLIQNFLRKIIVTDTHRLYARKLKCEKISTSEANKYFDANHLQGGVPSTTAYALKEGDEIVLCMSFTNRRSRWEIARYATSANIVGGAQRVFKNFIKENSPNEVWTYSDASYFDGQVYKSLGFEYQGLTRPNYHYVNFNECKRLSRQKFQKHKLVERGMDPSLTEKQIANMMGYYRVYGPGHHKFIYR